MLEISEKDLQTHLKEIFKDEFDKFNISIKFLNINNNDSLVMIALTDKSKNKNKLVKKINCKYKRNLENNEKTLIFRDYSSINEFDTVIKTEIFDTLITND